jgi:hypothetical protein
MPLSEYNKPLCMKRAARGLCCILDAKASGRKLPGFATEQEARNVANGRPVIRIAANTLHSGGARTMRWFVK